MRLVSADNFNFDEITEAYNQSRVDYLVPMPMNTARLKEYARVYDVDLKRSFVAVRGDTKLGLIMLGIRDNRSWITRLGVLPAGRRQGTGNYLMEACIAEAHQAEHTQLWLEVIKGNAPAHRLFTKHGFYETRELIVARRPPGPQELVVENIKQITTLEQDEILILLAHRRQRPNWLNETESFQNIHNLSGILVELDNGGRGWVAYRASLLQLTHIVVEVAAGDPTEVTAAVLYALHQRHKRQDAVAENLPEDEQWLGFQQAGYFDSFRRIEMLKEM